MTDSIYGLPIYGTSLYGASSSTNLLWAIEVDWDGDGVFDGSNEAPRTYSLNIQRGRNSYLRFSDAGKAIGFERIPIGKAIIELDNTSGIYDPYNTSSSLYGYVEPGKYIRIQVTNGSGGTTYPVFAGILSDIQPIGGRDPRVRFIAVDGLQWLSDESVNISVTSSIRLSTAIENVLSDAEYPTIWGTSIENASDIIDYFWADGRAIDVINSLAEANVGQFFIAADGKATFYSRNHTGAADFTVDQAELGKEIVLPQPWEVRRDRVRVYSNALQLRASEILWTLQDIPSVGAGETVTYWADYFYSGKPVPAINAAISSSDYTMNAQADGGGADLSGDFSVTLTDFGQTGKVVVTNNGGTLGYITLLQIVGDALDLSDRNYSESGTGKRVFTLDNSWVQDTQLSKDFASWLDTFLDQNLLFPTATIEARPALQFGADLFDVADLTIAKLGVDGNYKIGYIEHIWNAENGQSTITTWRLEPFSDLSGYWIFPTEIGISSVFGF